MSSNSQSAMIDTQPMRVFMDLPTLLQHEAQQRKTGRLRILGPKGEKVDIFLDEGAVVYCTFNGVQVDCIEKVFPTMFDWQTWEPQFSKALAPPVKREDRLDESMTALVLRTVTKIDEDSVRDNEDEPPRTLVKPPMNEHDVFDEGLQQILKFSEVEAWLVFNEVGVVSASIGFDSLMDETAACLVHVSNAAKTAAEPLQLGELCYASVILRGQSLLVFQSAERYLGLRLREGVAPRLVAERAEVLLGIRSELALTTEQATALSAAQAPAIELAVQSEGIAGMLRPLRSRPGVGGILVTASSGEQLFSTVPARPETLAQLGIFFAQTFRELSTVWSQVGNLAFIYDQGHQLLLKALGSHGSMAIICLTGTNTTLLDMPANVAARELTEILARGEGTQTPTVAVDASEVKAAASRIVLSYPDLEGDVRRFEASLTPAHDRSAWMEALGVEIGQAIVADRLLPRKVLKAVNKFTGSVPHALKSVVWPVLSHYSVDMGRTTDREVLLSANAFCVDRPRDETPQGDFVKGLIRGIFICMNISGVAIEEVQCRALGHNSCVFKVS